jgi:hypothetical protein
LNRALGLLAIAWLLAGCTSAGPQVPERMEGFVATVQDGSGQASVVSLGGPVHIRDATGAVVEAYRLEVADASSGRVVVTHYLDGELRLIRSDTPCIESDCEHYEVVSFIGRGALAPLGLGLDQMVARGNVSGFASRAWTAYPYAADSADGLTVDIREGDRFLASGRYRFHEGRRLPDGPQARVVDYEPKGVLPAVAAIRPPAVPPPDGLELFRGADQDPFGVGASPQDFLTALRESSQEARSMLQGGCVVEFRLQLAPVEQTVGGTVISSETRVSFVLVGADGAARRFPVSHIQSLAGGRFEVGNASSVDAGIECAEAGRNPAEAMDLSAFEQRFHALLDAHGAVTGFSFGYADLGGVTGRPPERSYERWRFEAKPEGAWVGSRFSLYIVEVDPSTGWVEAVTSAPGAYDMPWEGLSD